MTVKSPEFIYIEDFPDRASGSLNGLRLGVKDLFHIAGMPTTAGNPDWLSSHSQPATVTAPSVATLLAAGAVLLGKTLT
ncbi:MAG: amidase family protein, partial [Pseudomonadota bacterium]